jgi:two-component system, NarL family, nitrate/nitrite response regulator NarL
MTTPIRTAAARPAKDALADIRVLVVDGDAFSRIGLSSLLRSLRLTVVGEAGDATTAAAIGQRVSPDVALMDLDLLGTSGVEAVRLMSASSPRCRIVAIVADEHHDVAATLAVGASGCIVRDSPAQEVVTAIRAAAKGESVVSPSLMGRLVHRLSLEPRHAPPGTPVLSPREFEVLDLLARGWDNTRIATTLYVSHGTVKHHISNILRKLGVENRIQAAVRAVRDGLLDERTNGGGP